MLRKNADLTKRALCLSAFVLIISLPKARASDVERWTCTDKIASTTWTIVDGRMFVAKGKGNYTVMSNSSTLTVAYILSKTANNKTISYVNILDKTAKKLFEYNDLTAAIFHGTSYQPYEAEMVEATCVRK